MTNNNKILSNGFKKIDKIILPKELTADSVLALSIIYKYGDKLFSNLSKAEIEFRLELPEEKDINYFISNSILPLINFKRRDSVLLELLNVEDLNIDEIPIVNKLIADFKNKNFEDCSFFSWTQLTNILKDKPEKILKLSLPILKEYLDNNEKRTHEFFDYCSKAVKEGRITSFTTIQNSKELKVVFIDCDSDDIAEFLFYKKELMADIVVVFKEKDNIFIKIKKGIDIMDVIAILRVETSRKYKIPFDKINKHILNRSGVMEGIPHWNFDPLKNEIKTEKSVQLDKSIIKRAIMIGVDTVKMAKGQCPSKEGCIGKKCDFYSYNMLRCRKRRAGVADRFEQSNSIKSNIRVIKK